jgi:hypothetical protein
LATDSTIVHYCQLHAIITEDSPIAVRIFQDREDAARWLGVPLERLVENHHEPSSHIREASPVEER